tara:strand:- start:193 stop:354 length:162 start_codon:yes stop_codon:yes gene_type:complete
VQRDSNVGGCADDSEVCDDLDRDLVIVLLGSTFLENKDDTEGIENISLVLFNV